MNDDGGALDPLPVAVDVPDEPEVEPRPEHGWPGSTFVILCWLAMFACVLGAAGAALWAVIALVMGEFGKAGVAALATVALVVGWTVQGALAWHVSRFSRAGWWGAMAELTLISAVAGHALLTRPLAGNLALVGLVIVLFLIRYFWQRRADFRFHTPW